MPKFFVDETQISDDIVTLCGEDARHISFSLRMAKGEHITVCDNSQIEYACELISFGSDRVTARILQRYSTPGEPPVKIRLFQGLPKGDKLETIVQKSVECGVYEIQPFESLFCVAKVKPEAEEQKTARRQRIALEAAKQCGRGAVPKVMPTISFEQALARASEAELSLICYEDEQGTTLKQILKYVDRRAVSSISVLVGSEGGFSKNEVEQAIAHGIRPVSLGKRILRTETAPVFVLSCLAYEFEL